MSRIPQPREVADLKGAPKRNPQRYRTEPAKTEFPLGNPPAGMAADELTVWMELETYAAKGVLTGGERMVVELTCQLMAQFRRERSEFPANKVGHLISCLARLGLTPADRQKIGVEKPGKNSGFEDF